jgi:ribosomal protein S18 acetylase RimI-like enzyme
MKVMLCEDADWLLSEEAYSIYAPCMYHPTYKDYKGQMDDLLCDPSTKVFVCEDRNRKTGMMVLKFSEAAAEIIGIAVSEKLRRRGIGKQLIRRVMELDDLECVKAQTDDDSIGFYRRCGFSEEKSIIDYPDGSVVRYNCILNK